jgi:hypothetical protein
LAWNEKKPEEELLWAVNSCEFLNLFSYSVLKTTKNGPILFLLENMGKDIYIERKTVVYTTLKSELDGTDLDALR